MTTPEKFVASLITEGEDSSAETEIARSLQEKAEQGGLPARVIIQTHYGSQHLPIMEWWTGEGNTLHISVDSPASGDSPRSRIPQT